MSKVVIGSKKVATTGVKWHNDGVGTNSLALLLQWLTTQQTKTPNNAFHCPIFALMLGIIIGTIPMFHCHYWYFYFYPILVTVLGRSAQYW